MLPSNAAGSDTAVETDDTVVQTDQADSADSIDKYFDENDFELHKLLRSEIFINNNNDDSERGNDSPVITSVKPTAIYQTLTDARHAGNGNLTPAMSLLYGIHTIPRKDRPAPNTLAGICCCCCCPDKAVAAFAFSPPDPVTYSFIAASQERSTGSSPSNPVSSLNEPIIRNTSNDISPLPDNNSLLREVVTITTPTDNPVSSQNERSLTNDQTNTSTKDNVSAVDYRTPSANPVISPTTKPNVTNDWTNSSKDVSPFSNKNSISPVVTVDSSNNTQQPEAQVRSNVLTQVTRKGLRRVECFFTTTSRGNRIACAHIRCFTKPHFTILFGHGKGSDIGEILGFGLLQGILLGINWFTYDYSGYGISSGSPSELDLYADAEAAYQTLLTRYDLNRRDVILYGCSLGTVPTVDLATKHKVAGVILDSSVSSAIRTVFPFVKKTFCFDALRNIDKVGLITSPTLFIHGTADQVTISSHAVELHKRCSAAVEPLWLEGAEHVQFSLRHEYYSRLHWFIHVDLLRETDVTLTQNNIFGIKCVLHFIKLYSKSNK